MDDDELLRALKRIRRQESADDARLRKHDDGQLAEAEGRSPVRLAPGARSGREAHGGRLPLDEETRAMLSERLMMQLREPCGDGAPPSPQGPQLPERPRGSSPQSPLAWPLRERKSGIRVRAPHDWDNAAEEAAEPEDDLPITSDDSLSGTSVAPLSLDADGDTSGSADRAPAEASWRPGDVLPGAALPGRAGGAPAPRAEPPRAGDEAAFGAAQDGLLRPRPARRRTDPRARARTAATLAGWLSAAVLVSLLALRPAPFAPGAAPLPDFALETSPGALPRADAGRGADAEVHLGQGARLTVTLTPHQRVHVPVEVKAFLAGNRGARPTPVAIELTGGGGARLSGTREALFPGVAAGAWDLVFVIGQPGSLPEITDVLPEDGAIRLAGGRLLRQRVIFD